jgi:hypothetical protein
MSFLDFHFCNFLLHLGWVVGFLKCNEMTHFFYFLNDLQTLYRGFYVVWRGILTEGRKEASERSFRTESYIGVMRRLGVVFLRKPTKKGLTTSKKGGRILLERRV